MWTRGSRYQVHPAASPRTCAVHDGLGDTATDRADPFRQALNEERNSFVNVADILGFTLVASLGVWFAAAPHSVITLYTRFHGPGAHTPKPVGVRVIGLLWLAWMAFVALSPRP